MFLKTFFFVFFLVLIGFTVDTEGGSGTGNNESLKNVVENERLATRQKVENIIRDLTIAVQYTRNHIQQFTPQHRAAATNSLNIWRNHMIRHFGLQAVQLNRQVTADDLLDRELDLLPEAENLLSSLRTIMWSEQERARVDELLRRQGQNGQGAQVGPAVQGGQGQVVPAGSVQGQVVQGVQGGSVQGQVIQGPQVVQVRSAVPEEQRQRGSAGQGQVNIGRLDVAEQVRPGGSGQGRPGGVQEQGPAGGQGQKRFGDQGQGGRGKKNS